MDEMLLHSRVALSFFTLYTLVANVLHLLKPQKDAFLAWYNYNGSFLSVFPLVLFSLLSHFHNDDYITRNQNGRKKGKM